MVDIFEARYMTGLVNKIQPAPSFLMDTFFARSIPVYAETVDLDVVVGGQTLAPFVKIHQPGVVVEKVGKAVQSIKLPRIRMKKPFTQQDLYATRVPGGMLHVDPADLQRAREDVLFRDQQDLKSKVLRRMEWMAAKLLSTGKITYSGEYVEFEVDFLHPSSHKETLGAGSKWNEATAKIIENIRAWKRAIANSTGYDPDIAICGTAVADALYANADVRALLNNRNLSVGELTIGKSNYIGRLAGVDIYEYGKEYKDDDAATKTFIASDQFILVARNEHFVRHNGVIQDLDAPGVTSVDYFSKSWLEKDPSLLWILVESRPLPACRWPESFFIADVL